MQISTVWGLRAWGQIGAPTYSQVLIVARLIQEVRSYKPVFSGLLPVFGIYGYSVPSLNLYIGTEVLFMAAAATGIDALPTLEAQLQRLCLVAQERELAMPADTRLNNFGVAYDFEALTATYTIANLPITLSTTAAGVLQVTPSPYTSLP
jgi:hypothetical protein